MGPHHTAFAQWAALSFLFCAPFAAHADEPVWGWKATALAGVPVANADAHSARLSVESSVKWNLAGTEFRARERVRWLYGQGEWRTDADVRELTAAWRGKEITFTLGAQQLNWGRMDILRVVDLINPVDQHDLFLEELPESKLALWMANWEWQRGSEALQIIATPQVAVDRLPSRWGGLPVQVSKPGASFSNATLAVRYGFEALGWNADLIAARGWQTTPALQPTVGAMGVRLQGAMSRQNSVGISADKPLGGIVLRVEAMYVRRLPGEEAAGLGTRSGRQASLGAGLDVRAGAWFFASQAIAQCDSEAINGSTCTAFVSAIVQRKWLQDRLSARGIHIRDTRSGSSWTSMQASFELSPNQVVQLQGDWFRGESMQAFGSFKDRSRIATSVRLQF